MPPDDPYLPAYIRICMISKNCARRTWCQTNCFTSLGQSTCLHQWSNLQSDICICVWSVLKICTGRWWGWRGIPYLMKPDRSFSRGPLRSSFEVTAMFVDLLLSCHQCPIWSTFGDRQGFLTRSWTPGASFELNDPACFRYSGARGGWGGGPRPQFMKPMLL